MKIASIDIGSNTVLLLIAKVNKQGKIFPIINEYRMPRISTGLAKTGTISEKSVTKLFDVLTEYKKIIENNKCDKTIVNGTQALRTALNGDTIRQKIKDQFGFTLNIIEGETEALYSFLGAISSFPKNKNYLMIDIGGASTEIVHGNYNNIFFRKSFPIGVVIGKEKFLRGNPPNAKEINELNNTLNNIFKELGKTELNTSQIIAVAGTPTTLTALKLKLTEYSETKVEKSIITKSDLEFFADRFGKLPYDKIKEYFSPIINGREDVIFVGTLILLHLVNLFKKDKIYVSGRGLRYGAIIAFFNKNKNLF
jgi:exopolyphosphatase/guanosine-5'-triphosphate,3'-diphosphate pyrophosphatase